MIANLPPELLDLEIHVQDLLSEVESLKSEISGLKSTISAIFSSGLNMSAVESIQTRVLSSNIAGSNVGVADLAISGLKKDKYYMILFNPFMRSSNGAAAAVVKEGANTILQYYLDTNSSSTFVTASTGMVSIFKASDTTLNVDTQSFDSSSDILFGNGTLAQTHLILLELRTGGQ